MLLLHLSRTCTPELHLLEALLNRCCQGLGRRGMLLQEPQQFRRPHLIQAGLYSLEMLVVGYPCPQVAPNTRGRC